MRSAERIELVKRYVRRRLQDEVKLGPRGTKAKIARALRTSTAHMSNLLKEPPSRDPGEDLCRKAADYWGVSYAELERMACGVEVPPVPPPSTPPAIPDLATLRAMMEDVVAAALEADRLARTKDASKHRSGEHAIGQLPVKKRPTLRKG